MVRERNENFNRSCSWNYVNCKPFDSCRIFRPAAFHVTWCWLTPTAANQFSYKREFPAFLTRHRRHCQLFQWSIRRPRFPVQSRDKNYKKRRICTQINTVCNLFPIKWKIFLMFQTTAFIYIEFYVCLTIGFIWSITMVTKIGQILYSPF